MNNKLSEEIEITEEIVSCMCHEQLMRLEKYDNEEEIWISLYDTMDVNNESAWHNKWENIKRGVKMIFGKEILFCEIVIDKDNQEKMRKYFNNLKKDSRTIK